MMMTIIMMLFFCDGDGDVGGDAVAADIFRGLGPTKKKQDYDDGGNDTDADDDDDDASKQGS
eukprot:1635818-Karenia_brevis.AAC.1